MYLDGGVRRGTDVITALCLGARGVFIGRPYLYGLAAGGEAGICLMVWNSMHRMNKGKRSRDWKATTIEQFIQVVDSYIRWYNEKRIKISLGSLSPIEYRKSLGLTT